MVTGTFDLEKWERKRTVTMRVFKLQCLLLGMDYSLTFLTLWMYITTLVETDKPKLFYSLVSASYLLSGVVVSIPIGRWVDRTRRIRLMFTFCNGLVIFGNVTYTLYFSPWLLVVGRFIAGIGGPLRSVISGEVSRCFTSKQVINELSGMGMSFAVGFITGPGINFAFKNVDFYIGNLHFTFANIPGFYMAAFFLLGQIVVMIFADDLSKEYDLKAKEIADELAACSKKRELNSNGSIDKSDKVDSEYQKTSVTPTIFKVLQQDAKDFDVVLIFILSFFMYFWIVAFDMWLPMLMIDILKMGVTELNIIVFGSGVAASLFLLAISRIKFSDKAMYKMCLGCMGALFLQETSFAALKMFQMKVYGNFVLLGIWTILFGFMVLVEEVFLIGVLAKMTESKIQTFNESIRLATTRFGALVALLISALLFDYVEYVCLFAMVFSVVTNLVLILRRKTFEKPVLKIK